MDRSVRFWDRAAEDYSRKPIPDEAAYQKKLQISQEYFRPDMVVLEFGCGTGSTAIIHAPYVKHIQAIDFSPKMIDIARNKVAKQRIENITFDQSSIEDFKVGVQSFDAVLGLSVMHLTEKKEDIISKIYKMLKPGGIFITSTVCLGDNISLLRFALPVAKQLGLTPTVKVFTTKALEDSLTEAGFDIDYKWRPETKKRVLTSVFIVAKKADATQRV